MRKKFASTVEVEAYLAGEKIQCLECGKWFAFLANHLRIMHELTSEEYRELHALPAMTPLAGQEYRRAHREKIERLQATGALTYDHLPAATAKAASAAKPKMGVAKIEHAARIAELRPGDHHKLPPGAKRADGSDADHEREMQQFRRSVQARSSDE